MHPEYCNAEQAGSLPGGEFLAEEAGKHVVAKGVEHLFHVPGPVAWIISNVLGMESDESPDQRAERLRSEQNKEEER
jgi:hypothetical protein